MLAGIYQRLFQKKQSSIDEKKSAVSKRKHKMRNDNDKNVNKRSKLKQSTSKLSEHRTNRSSASANKHLTTIAGGGGSGKNERKSSTDRTVTSGKLPRTTTTTTTNAVSSRRTNSLPNQRKTGSKSQPNTHRIKSIDEIMINDEKISMDKRKVSTWLTNYGLHNQNTPTVSTIDQQSLAIRNNINRTNNNHGNLGPNLEYMTSYYHQLSPQTRDWIPNRIYANIQNNNNVNPVLNNSSRVVPAIQRYSFNNNYSMPIKKNPIKFLNYNQNIGTNMFTNAVGDGKINQQSLLSSTNKHRSTLFNNTLDQYKSGNDPNKLTKNYVSRQNLYQS